LSISVVIPAFNEEHRIDAAVRAVMGKLEAIGEEFEIVCVDDGSRDGTADRVARWAARDPRVRLVRLPENTGKGAAVREGVLAARGDLVFFLDADLSTPPAAIEDALPHLKDGADVVIGSRNREGARVDRPQGAVRRSLGRGFLVLARAVADPKATDLTCGFKGFRRPAAEAIFKRTTLPGWAFDAETALIARRLGLVRREIPVHWRNDPDSRVRVAGAIAQSLLDLIRLAWRDARGFYRASQEERDAAQQR
jgi:dolichyl-phosphate beta-glucosyltransferase